MQHLLNPQAKCFVGTGDHRGGQRVLSHFTRQVGTGQNANPRLRGDVFKDFTHQLEAVGFDAFGQADQHFAAQALGMDRQHRTQGTGRQCNETQITVIKRGLQVGDRLYTRMNFDAFKVARVFTVKANGLCLLRIAHPLTYVMAIFGQQVGHRSAKAPASQDRNSALFSHMQSRHPSSSGNGGIIRSTLLATSPPCSDLRQLSPRKMHGFGWKTASAQLTCRPSIHP